MNYRETVEKVMNLLKEKKVCASSRKSHRDCYESLSQFMVHKGVDYSDNTRDNWLEEIRKELPRQRYSVWTQYVFQLEEMDFTGSISDRRLYLNRSNYDKLPLPWRKDLDLYLAGCRTHYTAKTLETARIYCSQGLLILSETGACGISEVTCDSILYLVRTRMYCAGGTRAAVLQNTARMLRYYGEKGLCSKSCSHVLDSGLYPHIGFLSDFSQEHQAVLRKQPDMGMAPDELYRSITPFRELLKSHGYAGTTISLAKHALTALYLFLDIHSLGFSSAVMWIWFEETRAAMGASWRHWRRVLKLYEDFSLTGGIRPGGKYKYSLTGFDELPSWCREAINGFLDRKRREFRQPGTIRSCRCQCTRFCRFLVDHGYSGFDKLAPPVIKEFAGKDEHSTFKGRSSCFTAVRAFLAYLEEKGYTDHHGLEACLMSGSAPQDKITDVLTEEQVQRIYEFRKNHKAPIELRDSAIVLLGLRMGFRSCDILELRFPDIDWKNRQISIVMKKTKTQITLPMPVEVGNAVYSYITAGRPKTASECIFVRSKAPYGKLTGKVCTTALFRMLPERQAVKGGGFHVTRRTFATNLLRNHAGIDDVIDALGHRDPTSVMKYLLLDDDRSRKCGLSLEGAGILPEGGLG